MNTRSPVWDGAQRRIHLYEVGPRDGLQPEPQFVPTADKIALVDALSDAGLAKIEVTSFVSPTAIPQLRDAEVVLREIRRAPGVVYTALVPNVRGAERAIESRADELNLVMSASTSHNLANLRMLPAQSFAALAATAALAGQAQVPVNVSLSCSFGCPMEGDVPENSVLDWCARFVGELGAAGVTLCDTTGMAWPTQVAGLTEAFLARFPGTALTLHFHNTRGMGLANVLAGIDAGATVRLARRAGRLPVCARRQRQRVHRGDRPRAGADGLRHRHRPGPPAGSRAPAAGAGGPRRAQPAHQGRPPAGPAPAAGGLPGDPPAGRGAGLGPGGPGQRAHPLGMPISTGPPLAIARW
jgi:hydroxymethylglutaryl-CoA lyase